MSSIRTWGETVSTEELAELALAHKEFSEFWSRLNFSWHPALDWSWNDLRAIDYLHYEGIGFPPSDVRGATLISAEILRRAAKLQWVRDYDGELYLADDDPSYFVINPRARVEELQRAMYPQFDRFAYFVVRAAIDCLGWDPDATDSLRALIIALDDGELDALSKKAVEIRGARAQGGSSKRPL